MRANCKCDYCGFHTFEGDPGSKCIKCGQGILCARGSKGYPGIRVVRKLI